MLWVGLSIWGVSVLAMQIMSWCGVDISAQSNLMDLVKNQFRTMPIFCMLLLCIIQPFIEEVGFRLWGVGKQWMTIVSLGVMAIFLAGELGWWSIPLIVAMLAGLYLVRDPFYRTWTLAIVSSIAFMLAHLSGCNGDSGILIFFVLTDILGMALICCWIATQLGFWFSVLVHVTNNTLALLIPIVFISSPATETYSGYQITIAPYNVFSKTDATNHQKSTASLNDYIRIMERDSVFRGELFFFGEPAKILAQIKSHSDSPDAEYVTWKSSFRQLEERVMVTVKVEEALNWDTLASALQYAFVASKIVPSIEMTEQLETLNRLWLKYEDGTEVCVDHLSEDDFKVLSSGFPKEWQQTWTADADSSYFKVTTFFEEDLQDNLKSQKEIEEMMHLKFDYRPYKEVKRTIIR